MEEPKKNSQKSHDELLKEELEKAMEYIKNMSPEERDELYRKSEEEREFHRNNSFHDFS